MNDKNNLIGNSTNKEREAFEATTSPCENLFCEHGVTICKKCNDHKYVAYQCEFKSEEYIYEWTADEIINMSAEKFVNMIRTASETLPKNHDYNVYKFCKSNSKKCYTNGPLNVIRVNTSTACNIKCKFCDIPSMKPVYPEDKELYFNILSKIVENKPHLKYLQLTGDGEPFIYKKETLEFIQTLNTEVCGKLVIFSNCTLLNPEDIELMYNFSQVSGVKIQIMCSCSAITPETYKKVHNNNNFYKVIENIKLINKYNMLQNVNFVITPDNLHELCMYKQFWNENNIIKTSSTVVHDYCWPGATKMVYESAEYKQFIEG